MTDRDYSAGLTVIKSESQLQAEIILEVTRVFSDSITIWRNNTGALHDGQRLVRFGVPGQADISGILRPAGCRVEIEVKRAGGKQSQTQRHFEAMIVSHGGLYLLCNGDVAGQVLEPIRARLDRDRRVVR